MPQVFPLQLSRHKHGNGSRYLSIPVLNEFPGRNLSGQVQHKRLYTFRKEYRSVLLPRIPFYVHSKRHNSVAICVGVCVDGEVIKVRRYDRIAVSGVPSLSLPAPEQAFSIQEQNALHIHNHQNRADGT